MSRKRAADDFEAIWERMKQLKGGKRQAMQEHLTRLVGNNFRLAGGLVLKVLEIDQPLILEPEPENPYDAEAVKVCVDMTGSKYSIATEGPIIHLGYLPRSGGRTDTYGFGNRQALRIIQGGANWGAFLSFDPKGEPLVRIEVYEEE